MDLAELLYERLSTDSILSGMLAQFNGKPAIFERQVPPDNDLGWAGDAYPRIAYVVDWSEEPQNRAGGTATFNIWCISHLMVHPRIIEVRVKELLNGGIFHPNTEPVSALRWKLSDTLEEDTDANGNLIIGVTMTFDLLTFPIQILTGLDLLAALNQWTVNTFPDLEVDPALWAPTDQNPAIYWRMAEMQIIEPETTISWIEVLVIAHLIASTQVGRVNWLKKIVEKLSEVTKINLQDGSPLFFQEVGADSWADYLRTGQIRLTVRYGVLPEEETYETLNNAILDFN